jgi:hypothetical protein
MKQASLKLKMGIKNANIMSDNIQVRRIILNIMFSILAALALWYILILGNMVFNIIQRRTLEKEALLLGNKVGNLELSYLSVSKSVDLPLSLSLGFQETKATFATRKSLGILKLAQNEI